MGGGLLLAEMIIRCRFTDVIIPASVRFSVVECKLRPILLFRAVRDYWNGICLLFFSYVPE